MYSKLLTIATTLCLTIGAYAQSPIELAQRANNYFMAKWSDPTTPTNFKKLRPSNLWTRGVYYEGLIALNEVAPEDRYIEYIDKWGQFHKWDVYGGKYTTADADHQCCAQTYFARYNMVGGTEKYTAIQKNFDYQIAQGNTHHWTWIDAIQMAMPAYAMLTQITKDRKYIRRAMAKTAIGAGETVGYMLHYVEQ